MLRSRSNALLPITTSPNGGLARLESRGGLRRLQRASGAAGLQRCVARAGVPAWLHRMAVVRLLAAYVVRWLRCVVCSASAAVPSFAAQAGSQTICNLPLLTCTLPLARLAERCPTCS